MLKFLSLIMGSNKNASKTKPPRKRRLALETLENRELLSVTPYSIDYDESPAALVTSLDNTTAEVSVANTADIIIANAPAGYNAHDLAKVEAAKANNGLKDSHVTWTLIGGEQRLTRINAGNADLTGTLDLSGCAALTRLDCYGNQLTGLNISGCTALTQLNCSFNQLATLDVSSCTALTTLYCNRNQLKSLDVSQNTALTLLWCNFNQLTALDVSKITALRELNCSNNRLKFSTLPPRGTITTYNCSPQDSNISLVPLSLLGGNVLTIDLSSEYLGGQTKYTWHYANGTAVPTSRYTATNGIFKFTGLAEEDRIYCVMTNAAFPDLTLRTGSIRLSTALVDGGPSVTTSLASGVLTIMGTERADWIEIEQTTTQVIIHSFLADGVATLDTWTFTRNNVTEIIFYGFGGDDTFKNWHNGVYSSVNCTMYGGDGNDYLLGGTGRNIFDGGHGDNMIIGGTGTNVFYNTGLGSNCFIWRGANDSWAPGSKNGQDDAHIHLYASDRVGATSTQWYGGGDFRPWTDAEVFEIVDVMTLIYDVSGNYIYAREHRYNDGAHYFVITDAPLECGAYCWGNHILFTRAFSNKAWARSATIHEIGHAWDAPLLIRDLRQELRNISWNSDGTLKADAVAGDFHGNYINNSNLTEEWAGMFQVYFGFSVPQPPYGTSAKYQQKVDIMDRFFARLAAQRDPAPLKLSVPTPNIGTVTNNSISVSWIAVSNAGGYRVQYATNDSFTGATTILVTGTSATLTGLDLNTTYYVRILAAGAGVYSDSGYSDWKSATTATVPLVPPITPTGLTSTDKTTGSITLTWNAVGNATGYEIRWRTDDDEWTNVPVTGTSTTISVTAAGTMYEFQVLAVNDDGKSDWSQSLSVATLLPTPTGLTSTGKTANSITLSWSAVTGATGYEIQYRKSGGTFVLWTGNPVTETSAIMASLDANAVYDFQVRAVNAVSESAWSTTGSATTDPIVTKLTTPPLGNVTATGSSTVSVAWDAVTNANGYTVQYATNAAFTTDVKTKDVNASTTSTTLTDLMANTLYYVRVMATGTGNFSDSDYSTAKSTTTDKIDLTAPVVAATSKTSTSVTASWNAIDNANGYRIECATDAGFTQNVKTENVSSGIVTIDFSGLTTDIQYYVRVMATGTDAYNNSEWSNVDNATPGTEPLLAPTLDNLTVIGGNTINVTWSTVPNASGYRVEYATDVEFNHVVGMIPVGLSTTSASLTGLDPNTMYFVRVMATGTGDYGNSVWSDIKSAMTDKITLAAPVVTATSESSTSITVTWNAVDNASSYKIECASDANFTQNVKTENVASDIRIIDFTGLTTDIQYFVRVMALGTGAYNNSEWSNVDNATPGTVQLPAPNLGNVTATGSDTINVTWEPVEHASGYIVYWSETDTFPGPEVETKSMPMTALFYDVPDLATGTLYYFWVIAKGDGTTYTDSEPSEYATATPSVTVTQLGTPNVTLTVKSTDSILVQWTATPNAPGGYLVEWSTDSGFPANTSTKSHTETNNTLREYLATSMLSFGCNVLVFSLQKRITRTESVALSRLTL